ncbi:MAG: GNAT family N-acetyltransferase [Clostridiales bacterium]|nr:GNAT family N-acetyltransferase [Clostridiales bacterium]
MFQLRYATEEDLAFWQQLDSHISYEELVNKISLQRCYIVEHQHRPIGLMRYNLFWDNLPFLTLIRLLPTNVGQGFGTQAMLGWETEMRALGFQQVMTSTQSDEGAQHFYRKLGYKDAGCLILDLPTLSQAAEVFFVKSL